MYQNFLFEAIFSSGAYSVEANIYRKSKHSIYRGFNNIVVSRLFVVDIESNKMKDFSKVFLLLTGSLTFYFSLAFLGWVNPLVMTILGLIFTTGIIVAAILILRKRKEWNHQLPKEDRKQYRDWFLKQFRKNDN